MKGFIVYPTYCNEDGKTIVSLFGRLENGESFVSRNIIKPYFFIEESEEKKAKKLLKNLESGVEFFKSQLTNFLEEKVVKISRFVRGKNFVHPKKEKVN